MAQSVQDIMTTDVVTIEASSTVREAAQQMQAQGLGDVLVARRGDVCGIVTDRDIAIRVVADGKDPGTTKVGEICSSELVALSPGESVEDAIGVVREQAVRRLPVLDAGRPVGIVSLGDLAMERDRASALADVSAAPPSS